MVMEVAVLVCVSCPDGGVCVGGDGDTGGACDGNDGGGGGLVRWWAPWKGAWWQGGVAVGGGPSYVVKWFVVLAVAAL